MEENLGEDAYDQVVVGHLLQIVDEIEVAGPTVGAQLSQRVSQLVAHLTDDGIAHLLTIFFFQAEDGIRVKLVTGVQTCALPIFIDIRPRKTKLLPKPGLSPAPC